MRTLVTLYTLTALAWPTLARAQATTPPPNTPDAGSLRQQIEPARPAALPPAEAPARPAAPSDRTAPQGPTVTVSEFRFTGNTLLAEAELRQAIAPFAGRPLGFNDLQDAAQAVAQRYREAGWVVRAWLPRQDVTDGRVLIQVEEARFGAARLEGPPPARLNRAVWQRIVDAAQPSGKPLSAFALDRALLLIDDLPGVDALGSLAPGDTPGSTDLLVRFVDEPLATGSVGLDNTGARSTGPERLTAQLNLHSPLGFGERLNLSLLHTRGNTYGRLAGSVPVGGDGLRIGANISNLDYRLVGSQFSAFGAEGKSLAIGLDAQMPLLRERERNLFLSAAFDNKTFDNRANGVSTAKYRSQVATAGLAGNRYDGWQGGGASEASVQASLGKVSPDSATPRTDHSDNLFVKLRGSVSRLQSLGASGSGTSLFAAWNGQWADDNVDSSEKFYLGGPSGVRAYPANEGGGAQGQLVNIELRQRLGGVWQVAGLLDWGRVRQYSQTIDTRGQSLLGPADNTLDYAGYGLSAAWTGPYGLQLKATWARRIGSNPNAMPNGNDQDGTLKRDRFWLTLAMPFDFNGTPSTSTAPAPQANVVAAPIPAPAPAVEPAPVAPPPVAVAAAPAPAVAPPAPAAVDPTRPVAEAIEAWRRAWVARDVSAYLANYADTFTPPAGQTLAQWRAQRTQRVSGASAITLEFDDLRIVVEGDTARATFVQRYRASHFADRVNKTLTLQRTGGTWRITSEKQQPAR